jgi:hypothetical protein
VSARTLRPLVGDLRQLASVRRIVLDDGPERDVRALAFSTGGGLDFWAMADRSLDIGPLWCRGMPVAWQSPAGFRSPTLHDAEADEGKGFNRSFSGFLVTCGLDHIRQPEKGQPLHGCLPFKPARVLAHGEDWDRPDPVLFCEGEVVQARYDGEAMRLRRRIEAPVGGAEFRIADVVENLSSEPWDHALLYHFNLGFPAIAVGTEVRAGSDLVLGPIRLPDPDDRPASASYPIGPLETGTCSVSTPAGEGERFELAFSFSADTLPHLQIWRDLRPNAGVIGIEPCTSARAPNGSSGSLRRLAPGERCSYAVRLVLSGSRRSVSREQIESGDGA